MPPSCLFTLLIRYLIVSKEHITFNATFRMQRLIFNCIHFFLSIIAIRYNTVRSTLNVISVNKLLYYYKFKSVI